MKVSKAATIWIDYHKTHSKKNTVRSYQSVIDRFCQDLGESEIEQIAPEDVFSFLGMGNPCDTSMIRKLLREGVVSRWEIIEKETVDKIIFRTVKARKSDSRIDGRGWDAYWRGAEIEAE